MRPQTKKPDTIPVLPQRDFSAGILRARWNIKKPAGFGDISACLDKLGKPHKKIRAVHITGTNGKGAVCALLAETFKRAGYKTGLFTSPHITDIRERIQINGNNLSKADFSRLLKKVLRAEKGALSFFEALTAMSFLYFAERKVDIAVYEAGIGALWDCTNLIENPAASVITSVGFDHKNVLGKTLRDIARQKAGIIKSACPCIVGDCGKKPMAVIRKIAAAKKAPLYQVKQNYFKSRGTDWKNLKEKFAIPGGKKAELSLLGRKNILNAAMVYETIQELNKQGLNISDDDFIKAAAGLALPARFQLKKRRGKNIIIDGCHNPPAVKAFFETFNRSPFALKKTCFIVGFMKDKEYAKIIPIIAENAKHIVIVRVSGARALSPETAEACFRAANARAQIVRAENISAALALADDSDNTAVIGSFYLASEVLAYLQKHHKAY